MSWLSRLKDGLKKSSNKISENISNIVSKRKLDSDTLEDLEDVLIMADMGVETTAEIINQLSKKKFGKEVTAEEIKEELAEIIATNLQPCQKKLDLPADKPCVMMLVGVNGNGKTTTIGKLASKYHNIKKSTLIAACDTFRAAAIEQLYVWADRAKADFIQGPPNSDPASVAFKAIEKAKKDKTDIVMIDTAGRMHNKTNLMDELQKIDRVIKKHGQQYPHETILVLDATTGQNAISQVEHFHDAVKLTGIIVTKLDGSAKAGIVAALAKKFKLPIYAIGIGEKVEDLNSFDAKEFAKNLVGL